MHKLNCLLAAVSIVGNNVQLNFIAKALTSANDFVDEMKKFPLRFLCVDEIKVICKFSQLIRTPFCAAYDNHFHSSDCVCQNLQSLQFEGTKESYRITIMI